MEVLQYPNTFRDFFVFGLHLILRGKLDVERCVDLISGLHLILGGKLDVGRRVDLFLSLFDFGRKIGRRKT